jgi:hypothetical protein
MHSPLAPRLYHHRVGATTKKLNVETGMEGMSEGERVRRWIHRHGERECVRYIYDMYTCLRVYMCNAYMHLSPYEHMWNTYMYVCVCGERESVMFISLSLSLTLTLYVYVCIIYIHV